MNINKLISHYFEGVPAPEIFTFDAESVNAECNALISELLKINDIELSVVQSLTENDTYKHLTEAETLQHVILDKVTDGKGMGFGLYTTKNLITFAGGLLIIASGEHQLTYDGQQCTVSEIERVEGTVVFMAVNTNREINANDVVDNRTDCVADFNEAFLEDDDLDNLW